MSTPHSSVELRARVDTAIDPHYEDVFDVLDALHSQLAAHADNQDQARIVELRVTLAHRLNRLDHPRTLRSARARTGPAPGAPQAGHQ